jgi:S1-C subfamily serine protease
LTSTAISLVFNTAILSRSGGNQGIGLAIPSKLVKRISGELLASGRVVRGWIGIGVEQLTEQISQQIGYKGTGGLLVTGVSSRSPAAQLPWVREGANVLVSVDGTSVESPGQLRNLITNRAPGSTLKLEVWQDGRTRTFDVQVTRQPDIAPARE